MDNSSSSSSILSNKLASWHQHLVCHRLAAIIILFASVCVFYTFFLPLFPFSSSLPKFNSSFSQNLSPYAPSLAPVPSPSSNSPSAVFFRNAPWKAAVGRWLSDCYDDSPSIPIVETIHNTPCLDNCNKHGICNRAEGQCQCFHGYSGPGCQDVLNLECNLKGSPEMPFGPWVVSICSAHCDKRRAMCFCGEGSKYPARPVAEACGFVLKGSLVDWTNPDNDNLFTNDSKKYGWCNVNPMDAYSGKTSYKEQCDCKYDCTWGRFCETVTQCVCINQCSGNGVCNGGFCQCKEGWYGIDCSIPSSQVNPMDWPCWLRPGTITIPDGEASSSLHQVQSPTVVIKKKRPLIYVYDLPPLFNSHLLEGRHWKYECVNRIYDYNNYTVWTAQLYGAEIALYESMLASPHRTTNGEEADFFYVPVLGACLITRADDAPHLSMQNFKGLRSYLTLDYYRHAFLHISQTYPYWNKTAGRDHIWFFSWDEGACFAPKEIWNSMMLVHWGNTNMKYNYSTTGYAPDNWDLIPIEERGNHPCFDPEKDLVLPAWKVPDPGLIFAKYWDRPRSKRKTLFYFNGNLGNAYEYGRPELRYSMGIRQRLAAEFGSSPDKNGRLGRQASKQVIVTNVRTNQYAKELASSKFCGVLPGDGWSGRMEDSILHGCIPVIIQDGIQLLYENILDYDAFAIRINETDIPQLVNILRAVNETELESKLTTVGRIWQRFLYRDSVLLEAQRQKKEFNLSSTWAESFFSLTDDDAFATFIQVLHYKLYNDEWRRQLSNKATQSFHSARCKAR